MHLKRLTAAVAAALVSSMGVVAAQPAQAVPQPQGNRSLSQVLATDGHGFDNNWRDFDIAEATARAVLKARPKSRVGVLAQGNVALTAFLPTDRAFQQLVAQMTGRTPRTERAVFRTLQRRTRINTLENVLLYHVVPGSTITFRQALRSNGATLTTALSGQTLTVRVVNHRTVRLHDRSPDTRDATVIVRNLNRGNKQIAHGINRVLVPSM